MTSGILRCCENIPSLLVEYHIDSKFYVCDSCIKLGCWSRGIKEKMPITELESDTTSVSSPATEMVTNV